MKPRPSKAARFAARGCVVIYCRVSTDEQVDSGAGLDAQEASCRAYAQAQGWAVVAVMREEAVSGKVHPTKRPRFAEALALLASCEAGTLLVRRVDRLSRRLDHQVELFKAAEAASWSLCTTDGKVDTSTAAGKFQLQVMAAAAEYELNLISERTREGMAAKRASGAVHGRPTELPDDVLRLILDATTAGLTPTQIARLLTVQGVPTARGGPWRESSVRRALDSMRFAIMAARNPYGTVSV